MSGADVLQPGEGPSRAERDAGSYDVLFIGHNPAGQSCRVSVQGDRDPGYGSTSKMITEAALCLLQDAASTPGGIWTPAAAMGQPVDSPALPDWVQTWIAAESARPWPPQR